MEPYPAADFIIPGMKVGCLPYLALADSHLECFFSAKCLNDTARWISNLSSDSWPRPMDRSAMIKFAPNTSLGFVFTEMMLDHWKEGRNFSGYYHVCEPVQCTFTTVRANSFIYLFTLLIGLYGGLTVALRIIAPLVVQAMRFIVCQYKKKFRSNLHHGHQGILRGVMGSIRKVYRVVSSL